MSRESSTRGTQAPCAAIRLSAPTSSAACCGRAPSTRRARESSAAKATRRSPGASRTRAEFHRRHRFFDFLERIDGVEVRGGLAVKFHNEKGDIELAPPRFEVTGKLERARPLAADDFASLDPLAGPRA